MLKSELLNKIKNPDVPGLEDELPPPPPPPPPPRISENSSESIEDYCNNVTYPNQPSNIPFTSAPVANYNAPWWIPNEADSSDVYAQWYENAYKAALQASTEKDCTGKLKVKYVKKKSEVIDPKADAERVANAQKELSALMKPLKCDLCNAVMNSTLQAKLHYQGKPHQKKVSMYLNQSAKKPKTEDGQVSSTTNDWNSYCEICKIWFTSQTDATQHYAGKKHLKAAFGTTKEKLPKKGSAPNQIPIDPTGRYGIGIAFQPEIAVPVMPLPTEKPPLVIPPIPQYSQAPTISYGSILRCDLCGISVNRQDQLETHKRGTKHMKMMKLHNLPVPIPTIAPPTLGTLDYSIYRTPSGQYYCAPCDLSVNTEIAFGQHIESKKHKTQVNPKQPIESPVPAKKSKKK